MTPETQRERVQASRRQLEASAARFGPKALPPEGMDGAILTLREVESFLALLPPEPAVRPWHHVSCNSSGRYPIGDPREPRCNCMRWIERGVAQPEPTTEPAAPRAVFDAGIAAAEHAVATVSAAGHTHAYALGLAAAGDTIHRLFDNDEAWEAASDTAWDRMADAPQPGPTAEPCRPCLAGTCSEHQQPARLFDIPVRITTDIPPNRIGVESPTQCTFIDVAPPEPAAGQAQERMFPIMGNRPASHIEPIPWSIIAPHEEQARRNHGGQSLDRLAQRGGLDPIEAIAVLTDQDYPFGTAGDDYDTKHTAANLRLRQIVAERSAPQPAPAQSLEGRTCEHSYRMQYREGLCIECASEISGREHLVPAQDGPEPSVETKLAALSTLPHGWDPDGKAPPPTADAVKTVRGLVMPWSIVPLGDGGLQIEMHRCGIDVEIEVGPDGTVRGVLAAEDDSASNAVELSIPAPALPSHQDVEAVQLAAALKTAYDRQGHGVIGNISLPWRAAEKLEALARRAPADQGPDITAVVRAVLQIGKDHWVAHGTAIRPEDSELVLADVLSALQRARETGGERAALGERAEAAEATLVRQWQPIETAPKDGSFLVLLPLPHLNSRIQVATYHPNVQIVGGVFLFDLASQPTHWMPLPATETPR
jgi:hypothetical protein